MAHIGIDLGTTNSVAAIVDANGEVRVLNTSAQLDHTPSAVTISDTLSIGFEAVENAVIEPEKTVFSIKRLMGRSIDDPKVSELRSRFSYIVPGDDPDDRGVYIDTGYGKRTPEEISAMILSKVVEDASHELGEPVTHAVITVPAYFSDVQRDATIRAAQEAGLTVKRIMDEPTAAAIAFGFDHGDVDHRLLVFDMGGGTFDVAVGYVVEDKWAGEAISGDAWLGGDDFDLRLADIIGSKLAQTYPGVNLNNPRLKMTLRQLAERAKIELSERENYDLWEPINIELPNRSFVGEIRMTISRAEFENSIRDLLDKAIAIVDHVLQQRSIDPNTLTAVVLVGGATFVPLVRKALINKFGADKVRTDIDPMQAVAVGAAIWSDRLKSVICPKCGQVNTYEDSICPECKTRLTAGVTTITERDLGISVVDKEKGSDVFSVLIEAHTPFPLKHVAQRSYYTTGHLLTIPVYVGDNPKASLNDYLGLVQCRINPREPARMPVIVQFDYDRNRVLHVRIKKPDGTILYEGKPTRNVPNPDSPRENEWRVMLKNAIQFVESVREEFGEFIEEEQRKKVEELVQKAQSALSRQDKHDGELYNHELFTLVDNLGIATLLFMVDRLKYRVDAKESQRMAEQVFELKEAYRANNIVLAKEIAQVLLHKVNEVLKTSPGPNPTRIIGGQLETISGANG